MSNAGETQNDREAYQHLEDRLDDYQNNRGRPAGTVGLPQVLAALGADLRASEQLAKSQHQATLTLTSATVELDVTTTYGLEVDGKVKFWVFTEVDVDGKVERAKGSKITLTLSPVHDLGPLDLRAPE